MPAVSTSFNFSRHGALVPAVEELAALGFGAVELRAGGAAPDGVEAGRRCRTGRVRCESVYAPITAAPFEEGDPTRDLASTNDARRAAAVRAVLATLPAAAAAGAHVIVVAMGRVELGGLEGRGDVTALLDERRARRDAHLDAAARSLFELTRAEPGVVWSLTNRGRPHQIPDLEEMELLLSDAGAPNVAVTYDSGHAAAIGNLGVTDPLAWLERYGPRTSGVRLSDRAGDVEGLPPGAGEIDWTALRDQLSTGMRKTLEVGARHSAHELAAGAAFLRDLGIE